MSATPFNIGPHCLPNGLIAAPMAGVTDRPFRQLCKRLGAGMAVGEMLISDPRLWHTAKSSLRMNHDGETTPISVQIAGADPEMLAQAARLNVERGAQIIDINMGCPAKKVCNAMAGSALLADEALVERILRSVVSAIEVPVTLKIRTGPSPDQRNGVRIAQIAEDSGIAALSVHGRTRTDKFRGDAEYDTIAAIKQATSIPVIANGDLDTPAKAAAVLAHTGADGLMFGRPAQGNPWIFREVLHYLKTGKELPPPSAEEVAEVMLGHIGELHDFYGEYRGLRIARKHIGWYLKGRPGSEAMRKRLMRVETAAEQLDLLQEYFASLSASPERAAA